MELDLDDGAHVLDAGCGPAGVHLILCEQRVLAIDPLLDRYRELTIFQQGKGEHVRFRQQGIETLPGTGEYDAVFCLNVINHVRDLDRCLSALKGALAPNGVMVLSVDAHRSAVAQKIFSRLPGDVLHPQQYTLEQYERLLALAGLRITRSLLHRRERIFDYWVFKLEHA